MNITGVLLTAPLVSFVSLATMGKGYWTTWAVCLTLDD